MTTATVTLTRFQFRAMFVAFLVLALATAYSITSTFDSAADQHNRLAASVYDTDVLGCYAGNGLRAALTHEQNNLNQALTNTDRLFNIVAAIPGLDKPLVRYLTDASAANAAIISGTMPFPPRACLAAYASIRPPGHSPPPNTKPFG